MRRIFFAFSISVLAIMLAPTHSFALRPQGFEQGGPLSGEEQNQTKAAIGDQMLGKTIQNRQGQELGRVLALAARNDEVVYILMGKNDGTRELTPIPFGAAQFDPQADVVVLSDAADSKIDQAPRISLDDLQKLNDPDFEHQVHSYYGQQDPTPPLRQ